MGHMSIERRMPALSWANRQFKEIYLTIKKEICLMKTSCLILITNNRISESQNSKHLSIRLKNRLKHKSFLSILHGKNNNQSVFMYKAMFCFFFASTYFNIYDFSVFFISPMLSFLFYLSSSYILHICILNNSSFYYIKIRQ